MKVCKDWHTTFNQYYFTRTDWRKIGYEPSNSRNNCLHLVLLILDVIFTKKYKVNNIGSVYNFINEDGI